VVVLSATFVGAQSVAADTPIPAVRTTHVNRDLVLLLEELGAMAQDLADVVANGDNPRNW